MAPGSDAAAGRTWLRHHAPTMARPAITDVGDRVGGATSLLEAPGRRGRRAAPPPAVGGWEPPDGVGTGDRRFRVAGAWTRSADRGRGRTPSTGTEPTGSAEPAVMVAPAGFEPAISALRGLRPSPLDDGAGCGHRPAVPPGSLS